MEQKTLIDEIRDYCARANIEPSTLGVRALGNSRIMDRLERRIDRLETDEKRLRDYMAANPAPAEPQAGAA